jgi:NO-binding membrane sensor protein with MHYT domain
LVKLSLGGCFARHDGRAFTQSGRNLWSSQMVFGSMVIQALIAAAAAVPFFFRRQISRVFAAVRRDDQPKDRARR